MRPIRLSRFRRGEFLDDIWDYQPGEHVFACESTQQGKTTLMYQLAERVLAEQETLRFASLMPKPRDPATRLWAQHLNLRITDNWPPPSRLPWQEKPAGYVVWPKHLKNADVKTNREHLSGILRKVMKEQYWKGDSVTLIDDAHLLAVLLGLNPEIEEQLTAGASMGSAAWLTNQKPSGSAATGALTTFAYNATTHLFLGAERDERNIRRFSEIGGVDPDLIADVVRHDLAIHRVQTPSGVKNVSDKLYIHKGGPWMCIVGP